MLKRKLSSRQTRRGMALIYALLAAFAAATMMSSLFALTWSSKTITDVKVKGGQAHYLAEGGIEVAKSTVASAVANWKAPTNGTATINGEAVPYTVKSTGFSTITTDKAGIQTLVNGWEIAANTALSHNAYTAHRLVNTEATPVFQFAVFYNNDLEINPGPSMTLGGRVHSNHDMYLNCGGTLTCDTNYVHAAGSIFRNRKDDPTLSQGTVTIRQYVQNPFSGTEPSSFVPMLSQSQLAALGVANTSGYDSNFVMGWDANQNGLFTDPGDWLPWRNGAPVYWEQPAGYTTATGSTVMDSAQGVQQALTPQVGSIAMFEPQSGGNYNWDPNTGTYVQVAAGTGSFGKGYFYANAGLSIITDASGHSWKAYDGAGNDVTSALQAQSAVTLTSLYDARQANGSSSKIQVTQIDVGKLRQSGKFPSNGLIYAAQYGAGTGTKCKGVELVDGSKLGAPLTVASEDSIYIQGDYNTNKKQGAAVIGDAINLLSNDWDNSKNVKNGLPSASPTTYNVAMIAGNQDTVGSAYNGGLENLPRFHENWSGVDCTIAGSFVNLWQSKYATGAWVYGGNHYTAPHRIWSYDTNFNNVAKLPPFTPMTVKAVDAASW